MGWLYNQIGMESTLFQAWEKVVSNDGKAGVGGMTIDAFSENYHLKIKFLSEQLLSGSYKSEPLLKLTMQKPTGGLRVLLIPTVPDRIIQTSASIVLGPIINSELSPSAFAYRPNLSRITAASEIERLRNEGYQWVLDADIRRFFDCVEHPLLFERLVKLFPDDAELMNLLSTWLTAEIVDGVNPKTRNTIGLPQGTPIAPLLANLFLDQFDDAIQAEGLKLIRYADDFLILCKTKPQAEAALKLSESLLAELKLELNQEKTRITNFDEGFKYLGYLFIRSLVLPTKMHGEKWYDALGKLKLRRLKLPAEPDKETLPNEFQIEPSASHICEVETETGQTIQLTEATLRQSEFGQKLLASLSQTSQSFEDFVKQVSDRDAAIREQREKEMKRLYSPFLRTLYLQEQGSLVRKESERFLVEKSGKLLTEIHAKKVEQILLFGNIALTTPVMQYCLKENIPVAMLSQNGTYFGRLEATTADNAEAHRFQYLRSLDEAFSLEFAQKIVAAKIHNSRIHILRRKSTIWGSDHKHKDKFQRHLEQMQELLLAAKQTTSFASLRGYEGKVAALYFELYGLLFKKGSEFHTATFRRVRRPPTDPVNSLLSFSYTLLHSNIFSILQLHGLNPYMGFFHTEAKGNPALVNDLMEEFRSSMDSLVLYVFNRGWFSVKDFYYEKDSSACFLTNEARKRFFRYFEDRMNEETAHPNFKVQMNFRRVIEAQVKSLKMFISGKTAVYEPYRVPF
jgi:CRISPR-associated protein Cas1